MGRMDIHHISKAVAACLLALSISGCSLLPDWLGEAEEPPLPGERISILALEKSLEPDEGLADIDVQLPAPYVNANWPQAGGVPGHAMHHLSLSGTLEEIWRVSIGAGSDDENRLLASPVVAAGRIFTMDSASRVRGYNANTGASLWSVNLTPRNEEEGTIGGGLSAEYNVLYAATPFGDVYALDPETGGMYWKAGIGVPLRAAPTIAEGRVFVTTYDSRIFALDARTGETLWDFEGGTETTGLLGAASPAVSGKTVVVPFSSGEIFALRSDNGQQSWSDQLVKSRRFGSLSSIADINAFPIIDRGMVIAASFSGRMAAIDLRSGNRIWDQEISTLQTPWVAGDFIYVVSTDGELVCLSRKNGRIRWVRPLGKYDDPEDKDGILVWSGPVLGSDRLILVSNFGLAVAISPYDGEILGRLELSDTTSVPPIIANDTLYILTDDAELVALR